MPPTEPDRPPPPTAAVAGLLRLIAAGLEPVVEAEPCKPCSTISVRTATGWWLQIATGELCQPLALTMALPPSALVPPWTHGCQRDDWRLGSDARVVTPIDLLTVEQCQQLQQRLVLAPAPLVPPMAPWWDISNLDQDEELFLD